MTLTLLDMVKTALRVRNDVFDDTEIVPLIQAAKKDMQVAGVTRVRDDDPLIARAVIAYVKAHFGYDNPEAERFERIYETLKGKLTQISAYAGKGRGNG